MILLSFSSSVKYVLSLILAVLGFLPMEKIIEKENTNAALHSEIKLIHLPDTIAMNDSLFIRTLRANMQDSLYFHILSLKNSKAVNFIDHDESISKSVHEEYINLSNSN
jgi:hypothetical protein